MHLEKTTNGHSLNPLKTRKSFRLAVVEALSLKLESLNPLKTRKSFRPGRKRRNCCGVKISLNPLKTRKSFRHEMVRDVEREIAAS